MKRADKAFWSFLKESGADCEEYHLFEEVELADWLSKFWFAACTQENTQQFYSVNSLKSFKYMQ